MIFPLCPSPFASMITSSLTELSASFIEARSSKFLPIIFATSSTLGSSATGYSPTSSPFLKTVIISHTAYTCSRKCVTNTIPTPSFFNLSIILNNFSTSLSSSEEVGSSNIRTLESISTALAIATICCSATE